MKYQIKNSTVEATQWFKNGDHPDDATEMFTGSDGKPFEGEGHVVRYYRNPEDSGERMCERCGHSMHEHGWIDQDSDGITVCPGNWVISLSDGAYAVYTSDVFERSYDVGTGKEDNSTSLLVLVEGGSLPDAVYEKLSRWIEQGFKESLVVELPPGMKMHVEALGRRAEEIAKRTQIRVVYV
jgi:hypothetical protein